MSLCSAKRVFIEITLTYVDLILLMQSEFIRGRIVS
jgi:hypothetical protein